MPQAIGGGRRQLASRSKSCSGDSDAAAKQGLGIDTPRHGHLDDALQHAHRNQAHGRDGTLPTCDSAGASDDHARSYTWRAIPGSPAFLFLFWAGPVAGGAALCFCPTRAAAHPPASAKLALVCLFGAGVIVWRHRVPRRGSGAPRAAHYRREAAAPVCRHPRVADGPGSPTRVYLIPEGQRLCHCKRGGFFGIGGKRVVGLGVPLLPFPRSATCAPSWPTSLVTTKAARRASHRSSTPPARRGAPWSTCGSRCRRAAKPFEWMLNRTCAHPGHRTQPELAADEWAARITRQDTAQSEALQSTGLHGQASICSSKMSCDRCGRWVVRAR